MKHFYALVLFLLICKVSSFAQIGTDSAYLNLKRIKVYSGNFDIQPINSEILYKIDEAVVSKYEFDKLTSSWQTLDTCCPCIVTFYDKNEILIREQVLCRGYEVGYVKDFYPNGKLKMTGQYMENHTGNWNYLVETGRCCVHDGIWVYYNPNGDTTYTEVWEKGKYIGQFPEQPKTEILSTWLTLDNKYLYNEIIRFEDVNKLNVEMTFKNSHRDSLQISIIFVVISSDGKHYQFPYTLEEFKKINLQQILSDLNISPAEYHVDEFAIDIYPGDIPTRYIIEICNNGKVIASEEIFPIP